MDPLFPILAVAALVTAALSATFGMAGGLVLMGVYTSLLAVPLAMVLHGVTQLVANGGRAVLLRSHVQWGGLGAYLLGAAAAWGIAHLVDYVPTPTVVFLGLGSVPFLVRLLPAGPLTDFADRRGAALCGLLVVGTQMLFGVAGPLLDVFFLQTRLTRREVVATKATTQTASHLLKIAWFLPLLDADQRASLVPLGAGTVAAAVAGTWVGGRVLEHMSEAGFRSTTRRLVLAIGAFYLCKGAWSAWGG